MKIQLSYGYIDLIDAELEHERILKSTRNIHAELWVDEESGAILVSLYSPWRFEIKKYVERFLGDHRAIADNVIDENIVQE